MRSLSMLFLGVCLAPFPGLAATDETPNLFVYLGALDPDAVRLEMTMKELMAVGAQGETVRLTLQEHQIRGSEWIQPRLLAVAFLPIGSYNSFEVVVKSARLGQGESVSKLIVPDEPTSVPVSFRIDREGAAVIQLDIGLRDTLDDGYRFTPRFQASLPRRPAAGLLGVVSMPASRAVFLLDKVAGQIVGAVPLRGRPGGMALDPLRPRVYVALPDEESIAVVGLLDDTVQQYLRLQGGDQPVELAVSPLGESLFVANSGSSTISVVDLFSLAEVARIRVGEQPRAPLVDRSGERLYVFNTISASVSVIDTVSRQVQATIATEPGPFLGQLNQDGDRLFVIHRHSPFLSIIDTVISTVTEKILIGPGATALKSDIQADRLYLSRKDTGLIELWDPLSRLPVESIAVESDVTFLAIDRDQYEIFSLLTNPTQMRSFEITGSRLSSQIDLPATPSWVVLNAAD